jgi:hypothetical protein
MVTRLPLSQFLRVSLELAAGIPPPGRARALIGDRTMADATANLPQGGNLCQMAPRSYRANLDLAGVKSF